MENFKKAVEELRSKNEHKDQAIAAKIAELETQEKKLVKLVSSLREKVVEAELSNDIEKAGKLKKNIGKTKAEIIEIQEQKNAYKQASSKNKDFSKELAEIKKLGIEAKENRFKKLSETRENRKELERQAEELEKNIQHLKRIEAGLYDNEAEGYVLQFIAPLLHEKLKNIDGTIHVSAACQSWLTDTEERFLEKIGVKAR